MATLSNTAGAASDEQYTACVESCAQQIAMARCSAEGQEGLGAFFEKRRPSWDEG